MNICKYHEGRIAVPSVLLGFVGLGPAQDLGRFLGMNTMWFLDRIGGIVLAVVVFFTGWCTVYLFVINN